MPRIGFITTRNIDTRIDIHAADPSAHHERYTDAEAAAVAAAIVAAHAELPTVHQDAPALIAAHAALTTGIHGVGLLHVAGFHAAGQALSKIIWLSTPLKVMEDDGRLETLDWTDLDLNSVTSDNAKLAILLLQFRPLEIGTGSNSYIGVRKNGETPDFYPRRIVYIDGFTGGERSYTEVIVGMDSNQVIEYRIYVGTDWEIDSDIEILGYIE
ncbi:hypothetical protein ES708_20587 [subsurface metagenome]